MNTPLYPRPVDALVAEMVDALDDERREDFEERAAIITHEAGFERGHAECLALLDLLRRHPALLSGVVVVECEISGATQWWLTTDHALARQQLADVGGREIAVLNPRDVIDRQYDGVALLSTVG